MIPKYNWGFSIFNLTEETPKEISRLQGISKAFFAVVTGAAWFAASSDHALIAAGLAIVVDTILACFYVEKIEPVK